MRNILCLILVCIFLVPFSLALEPSDYLKEFNNQGETCQVADIFHYQQWEPIWWQNNRYVSTVATIYQCCEEEICVAIPIDIQSGNLLHDISVKELIDLNFIKSELHEGNLSETYFVNEGLDTCYFHGKKELTQESLNLAADTAEAIAATRNAKQAKQVVTVIKTARTLEILSPFSIADFSLSVACTFNSKKLEIAIETLATCNLYLRNIKNNFAQSGYTSELSRCYDKARGELKEYLESDLAKSKHYTDKTGNFFHDLFTDPSKMLKEGEITDTEYEIAKAIYDNIPTQQILLTHPRKDEVFQKYVDRILQKQGAYIVINNPVQERINTLEEESPWKVEIWFSDIFTNPNFNITEGSSNLEKAKRDMIECRVLYNQNKFNSAIKCVEQAEVHLAQAEPIIQREINFKRSFDQQWIIIGIGIIIFVAVAIYLLRREPKNQYGAG